MEWEGEGLTQREASQRLRKGSRTVALIWPQADTMRLAATRMAGEVETRWSAAEAGLGGGGAGMSREGKSSLGGDGGGEVGGWTRVDCGLCGVDGDVGGVE